MNYIKKRKTSILSQVIDRDVDENLIDNYISLSKNSLSTSHSNIIHNCVNNNSSSKAKLSQSQLLKNDSQLNKNGSKPNICENNNSLLSNKENNRNLLNISNQSKKSTMQILK